MENEDIIKYLALTIAHKEKVIVDLIRQLDDEKQKADRYAEYWREDSAALKEAQAKLEALQNPYIKEGKTCCKAKGSADDILNGNA